jgi:hypothetical protein
MKLRACWPGMRAVLMLAGCNAGAPLGAVGPETGPRRASLPDSGSSLGRSCLHPASNCEGTEGLPQTCAARPQDTYKDLRSASTAPTCGSGDGSDLDPVNVPSRAFGGAPQRRLCRSYAGFRPGSAAGSPAQKLCRLHRRHWALPPPRHLRWWWWRCCSTPLDQTRHPYRARQIPFRCALPPMRASETMPVSTADPMRQDHLKPAVRL